MAVASPAGRVAAGIPLSAAVRESFRKLSPRSMVLNPVMFVVEIGSVFTSVDAIRYAIQGHTSLFSFTGQISIWLWLTVLFANFAEALAEGRGQAQAAALRSTRTDTVAKRLVGGRADRERIEEVVASQLRAGDRVVVEA